eukprot:CAMPEP_0172451608 /NCGR_PEP_ID=MMETSP1065-20121228/9581_1 /TAXON_ID=265537 /ORGANISM="Amphiprora paludosa, Strain CCMP125" /LENGTH=756 /DNA_ID=CAMNT_0013203571 /DNA_START=53 /DNA_END=2323 /DNA_ORIENTATION=+
MISINAGDELSQELNLLHHVAQDEYNAGVVAGQRLIDSGATQGICINHAPGVKSTEARCAGLEKALEDAGLPYLGEVPVPLDNVDITTTRVEDVVNFVNDGNWENLGLLSMGQVLIPVLRQLAQDHPEAIAATFDTSPSLGPALEANEILFGIDQRPYLQGYFPVLMLTWFAQTEQVLANHNLLSGPSLVLTAPSNAETVCQDSGFPVCLPPLDTEENQLGSLRILGIILGSLVVLVACFFALVVTIYRQRQNIRQSQPFFLLMVCLGAGMMGSTIIPLSIDDEIVSDRGCDAACMSAPWLFTLGFTFVFAALYSKLMRLNKLVKNAEQFRHIQVTVMDVMTPFTVQLTLNLAFLTTWTLADPMYWRRTEVSPTESYGICRLGEGGVSVSMAALIFGVNLLALILALWEAYKSRKVTYELSDGGSVAMVVVSIFQVAIVGVPILPLVRDDPSASYLLKCGLVFVISFSTLMFIFVPVLRKKGLDTSRGAALSLSSRKTSARPVLSAHSSQEASDYNFSSFRYESSRFDQQSARFDGGSSEFMRHPSFVPRSGVSEQASEAQLNDMESTEFRPVGRLSDGVIMEEGEEAESPKHGTAAVAVPVAAGGTEDTTSDSASDPRSFLDQLVSLLQNGTLGRQDVMNAIGEAPNDEIDPNSTETTALVGEPSNNTETNLTEAGLKEVAGFIQTRGLNQDFSDFVTARQDTPNHDQVVGVLEQYALLAHPSGDSTEEVAPEKTTTALEENVGEEDCPDEIHLT